LVFFPWCFHHCSMVSKASYLPIICCQQKPTRLTNRRAESRTNRPIFRQKLRRFYFEKIGLLKIVQYLCHTTDFIKLPDEIARYIVHLTSWSVAPRKVYHACELGFRKSSWYYVWHGASYCLPLSRSFLYLAVFLRQIVYLGFLAVFLNCGIYLDDLHVY